MRIRALILAVLCLAACNKNENVDNEADATSIENAASVAGDQPRAPCDVIHERVTAEECADLRALRDDVRTGAAALDVPDPMTRGKPSEVTLVVDRRSLEEIRAAEQVGNAADADNVGGMGAADTNAVDLDAAGENAVQRDDGPVPPDHNAVVTDPAETGDPAAETPNQVVANLAGEDHPFSSRVGRYMTASLVGEGFEIKLISPSDPLQEIPAGGSATWIWEVTPRQGGRHTLTALTEAVGKIDKRAVPLGNGRTSKIISVEVRPMDRLWDAIVAAPDWLKALGAVLVALTGLLAAWFTLGKTWRNRNAGP